MQMINSPIIEFDVHGMRTEEAVAAIQKQVDQAGSAVYEIRVIHGYNAVSYTHLTLPTT